LGEGSVEAGEQAVTNSLQETSTTSSRSEFLWICDPIDGTANFASGLPLCGVTVAVVYQGTPVVGVIYDPHRDELFSAVRGQGATLNGKSIHVTTTITELKNAIINAGCPADPNAFAASMRGMMALNGACRGLRVIACSAMTLSWIACGRLTAHFGYDLSSWDLVAGALIIQEAGGVVTDIDGSPYILETRNMLCSNGLVHDDTLQILQEADAVTFERAG
jgi:myo-inositol-1(or 4)-monophosphatase